MSISLKNAISEGGAIGNNEELNKFKVRLHSPVSGDTIFFNVSPDSLTESRTVNYKSLDPTHMPGNLHVYQNTPSRTFSLAVKLISRTSTEALENLQNLNVLRAWTMPYFGKTKEHRGAPPDILMFTAYSSTDISKVANIRNIPVVITGLTIPYPNDVDYIPTEVNGAPFPVLMTIDISLAESQSPKKLESFDLKNYKAGKLPGF